MNFAIEITAFNSAIVDDRIEGCLYFGKLAWNLCELSDIFETILASRPTLKHFKLKASAILDNFEQLVNNEAKLFWIGKKDFRVSTQFVIGLIQQLRVDWQQYDKT